MTFGTRLRILRLQKDLTQADLAKSLGLGESTVSFYESDKREPDYRTLKQIANFFGVSTDYLLCQTNNPKRIIEGETVAAHRLDDPMDNLPPDAKKSLEEFQDYIFKKYGLENPYKKE